MSGTTQRAVARANRSALKTPHILNERRAARRFLLGGVIDFRSTTLIGIEPLERLRPLNKTRWNLREQI
jgi:hypothetical protein